MIEVINVRGLPANKEGIVYIGRPCKGWVSKVELGNPYKEGKDGDLQTIIEKYRRWLWDQMTNYPLGRPSLSIRQLADMHADGKDIILGCWCKPKPCHGDVVKRAIEWQSRQ